jgi:hypothetical protein
MATTKHKEISADHFSPVTLADIVDRLFVGHASNVMKRFPNGCIDLIVTSPPYWTAVEYDQRKNPWPTYENYLAAIDKTFRFASRIRTHQLHEFWQDAHIPPGQGFCHRPVRAGER